MPRAALSLMFTSNGDDSAPSDYQGERTASAITAFMRKKAQPAVRKLESAHDLEEFIAVEDTGVVLYSTDDDGMCARAVQAGGK